jgi:large subunit ribosomal protein L2
LEKFNTKISLGSWSFLNYIPLGTLLYNIELYPYKGGKYCRSAGTFSILLSKNNKNVFLKMKSKWKIIISNKCAASLGVVSNKDYKYINKKKAGVVRNFGKRMSVRGLPWILVIIRMVEVKVKNLKKLLQELLEEN